MLTSSQDVKINPLPGGVKVCEYIKREKIGLHHGVRMSTQNGEI
jgi:hypothetical protein